MDVKIPYEVYLALLRVHIGNIGSDADLEMIRKFLEAKTSSLARRQQYTNTVSLDRHNTTPT